MTSSPTVLDHKTILYGCLNWGMGHVSRSIPIIEQLLLQENRVLVLGTPEQIKVFQNYFPNCEYLVWDGYPFNFKGTGKFERDIFSNILMHFRAMKSLKKTVDKLVSTHKIDTIISDHLYGLRHVKTHNIFITHQLNLPLKKMHRPAQFFHDRELRKYANIWVLDNPESSNAGKLSRNKKFNQVQYIGIQSRFSRTANQPKNDKTVLVINGPVEYARKLLAEQENNADLVIAPQSLHHLVKQEKLRTGNWKELDDEIRNAKKIIAYFGYSTWMDLQFLNCEFELFPTKGQAEQEYLADLHQKELVRN